MMRGRFSLILLACTLALSGLSAPADAKPHDPTERRAFLEQIHDLKVKELSALLELDEAGRAALERRLRPFDEERASLRLETFEAMKTLKDARKVKEGASVAEAARKLAARRVRLAEIDVRELDAVLEGLEGDKAARAAIFMTRFPRRVEKMAAQMHKRRHGKSLDD